MATAKATARREAARAYVEHGWRALPHTYAEKLSCGLWIPYDYLRHISLRVATAIGQGRARIIVNMPPRHGKSELLSFWTPG